MIDLSKLYREINRDYYSNLLPKRLLIQWSKWTGPDGLAGSHVHGITPCKHPFGPLKNCGESYIRIHPMLQKINDVAALTLIHEIVHVSAVLGEPGRATHGPLFHGEMRRLATLGAMDPYW